MSAVVSLTLRAPPDVPLEAECIRPDVLAGLSQREIEALPLWIGREQLALGELFEVQGGRSADVRVEGDASRVKYLGAGMAGGTLTVAGSAGAHAGERMTGGTLRVLGNAADFAGAEMAGGLLELGGDAGAQLGGAGPGGKRGMRGGVIVVHGGAGDFAGARMRRGLIAVRGQLGDQAGAGMMAGTLLAFAGVGRRPGLGLERGTLVVHGSVRLLPTFRFACTYQPPFLGVYLHELRQRYGAAWADDGGGRYHRYTGDYAELGKGEVLVWAGRR